jgi:hypothetical protein
MWARITHAEFVSIKPKENTMQIQLKALKYSDFASQETHCFQANIYIDGKMRGTADNDGRGGMTSIHPHQLYSEIKLHTDKIPPRIVDFDGTKLTLEASPDSLIDELVTLALHEKDLKQAMRKKILFTRKNQVFETQNFDAAKLKAAVNHPEVKQKLDADEILNLLPMADALTLYVKAMES